MTESQFTTKLLRVLRAHPALRDAVIWKLNDRSNSGVPDFSISRGRATLWVEVKIDPAMPTKLQAYYLERLRNGGCLVAASKDGKFAALMIYDTSPVKFMSFKGCIEELARYV